MALETALPEAHGIDSNALTSSLNRLTSRLTALHTVLVARGGSVVLDASFQGKSSRARHILNSCTKSVLAAIVGVAVERGLLKVTDSVTGYFPSRMVGDGDGGWKRMTLHHLLSMSSGISWPQYGPDNISDAMGRSDNWVEFILRRPMEGEPGTIVNYSNGDSHLVSAILQEVTGKTALEYATEVLFEPLGITDVEWNSDPQGRSIGSATLYLQPIDAAKIGLLFADDGKWAEQQIVPAKWIAESWREHGKIETSGGPAGYGYYWWLYPEMNLCQAWGGAGQRIGVLRNTKTVVVVTANDPMDTPRSATIADFYADVEQAILKE